MNETTIRSGRSRRTRAILLALLVAASAGLMAQPAHAAGSPSTTQTRVYAQPVATMPTSTNPAGWGPLLGHQGKVLLWSPNGPATVNVGVRWDCNAGNVQNVTATTVNGFSEVPWPTTMGIVPPSDCTLRVTLPSTSGAPQFVLHKRLDLFGLVNASAVVVTF